MASIVHRADVAVVVPLLLEADLPVADLTEGHRVEFLAVGPVQRPEGVVGFERLGSIGLLRSLAVSRAARGRGLGAALVAAVEREALDGGIRTLYLLTTTADAFFAKLGYARLTRAEAPEQLRATSQFSALCPASAVLMAKFLAP